MGGSNRILEAIPCRVRKGWGDFLKSIRLNKGEVLLAPGARCTCIYFPVDCIVSLTTDNQSWKDGLSLIGNEGVVGASVLLGDASNSLMMTVDHAGRAYSLPVQLAINELSRSGEFRMFALNYMQALVFNALQTAICDSGHTIFQKIIKELLIFDDRMLHRVSPVSQSYVAKISGVSENAVEKVFYRLSEMGYILITNKLATIEDRVGLEGVSCNCYKAVNRELDRLLPDSVS